MILLSEVSPYEVIGKRVLSFRGKVGRVSTMHYSSRYKRDDVEQNPVVTVDWDDGSSSLQAHANYDYVALFCW